MHSHDGTDIASQIPSTGRDGEVFGRVEAVCVDHEVAVVLIYSRSFAPVATVEKLCHGLSLNVVNCVHVEPSTVAGKHNGVHLGDEMVSRYRLDLCFRLGILSVTGDGVLH